jgi:hypothetical protein
VTRNDPTREGRAAETLASTSEPTPTEIGAVVDLGDPEVVAAEVIEKRGAAYGRQVAAWVLLLAEEVGK